MSHAYATLQIVRDGKILRADLRGYVEPPVRGCMYGPAPEFCEEPCGGYAEVESATVDGKPIELHGHELRVGADLIWEAWSKPYEP